ncbi:hypothetical protein ACNKU7_15350 [Microbulbifer sp. SA54]|uniref:hypothetical protein n=1 Tax=Microbulbifer sp. SA54 TaxID=3401577 RepID=UPI003AAF6498
MIKFKVFFTFLAIIWLCLCGAGSIYAFFATGNVAWMGVAVNALALPIWLLARQIRSTEIAPDLRESPAFAGVLIGLGVALLLDTKKGMAVYLAIYNLFVFLLYLYHLSAIRHPSMVAVNSRFPQLQLADSQAWDAADNEGDCGGFLLLFLRGSFCAESRWQLWQLLAAHEKLSRSSVRPVLISMESRAQWLEYFRRTQSADIPDSWLFLELNGSAESNELFIANSGAPLLCWHQKKAAVRPSAWLLDTEGYVVWRHLPANYRDPGSITLIADQLYRLEE